MAVGIAIAGATFGAISAIAGITAAIVALKRYVSGLKADEKKRMGIHDNIELTETAKKEGISVEELTMRRIDSYKINQKKLELEEERRRKESLEKYEMKKKNLEINTKQLKKTIDDEKNKYRKVQLENLLKKRKKELDETKDIINDLKGGSNFFSRKLRKAGLISNDIDNPGIITVFSANELMKLPIYTSLDNKTYLINRNLSNNIISVDKVSDKKIFGTFLQIPNFVLYLNHTGEYLFFFSDKDINEDKPILFEKTVHIKLEEKCDKIMNIGKNIFLKSLSGTLYFLDFESSYTNNIIKSNEIILEYSSIQSISKPEFIDTPSLIKDIRILMNKIVYLDYEGKIWINDRPIDLNLKTKIIFNKMKLPNNVRISMLSHIHQKYEYVEHLLCLDDKGNLYGLGSNIEGELGIPSIKNETKTWQKNDIIEHPIVKTFVYEGGSIVLALNGDVYHFGRIFNKNIYENRIIKNLYIPSIIKNLSNSESLILFSDIILSKKRGSEFKIIDNDYFNGIENNQDNTTFELLMNDVHDQKEARLPEFSKSLKLK